MIEPVLRVFPDPAALTQAAAAQFATLAIEAVAAREQFLVALSGGSTPQALFKRLSQPPYSTVIPWRHIHIFWGDERLVPPEDEGSNYYHAQQLLFDYVPLPPANIHRARGEFEPAAAVRDYINQLQQAATGNRPWPRFDLVLLGMGSDGHTASLFPGSIPPEETRSPVQAVTAIYEDRPAARLTLTPLVFNDARHVVFLVTGENKAAALAAVLQGPDDPAQWPAQRIQPHHGTLTWLVDEAAASQLNQTHA